MQVAWTFSHSLSAPVGALVVAPVRSQQIGGVQMY